jgi:hypothetical protein
MSNELLTGILLVVAWLTIGPLWFIGLIWISRKLLGSDWA